MGYTRYWKIENEPSADSFKEFLTKCELLINDSDIPLDRLHLGEDVIRFNGVGADSHEDFVIKRKMTSFDFCKTARKPYDFLVWGCLKIAEDLLGAEISSDGDNDDDEVLEKLKSLELI